MPRAVLGGAPTGGGVNCAEWKSFIAGGGGGGTTVAPVLPFVGNVGELFAKAGWCSAA